MKKLLFALFAAVFLFCTCFSQTVAEGVPVTKEGHEVFATITKWADAVKSRDAAALDKIFAQDMIVTTGEGTTRGKKEELDVLKPNADIKTVSIKNEDIKVRFFGNAAVVTALTKMHFVIREKDVHSAFRYTAVFVKEDGRWQIYALQTARALQQPTK